jgi:hypothetical protein
MSQEDTTTTVVHPDALELAAMLRPEWPSISSRLRASGVPLCEGDDGGGDGGDGGDGDGAGDGDGGGDGGRADVRPPYVEQLRRENAAARKRAQEAEARAKEFEDRDKSEQEKATERAEAAERRAAEAEIKVLRADVAADKNVPAKLAKFLTGSTKQDLEKSADELLAELKANGRTSFDGGPRDSQVPAGDMDTAIRRAGGRG